jgi:hypothetical protein
MACTVWHFVVAEATRELTRVPALKGGASSERARSGQEASGSQGHESPVPAYHSSPPPRPKRGRELSEVPHGGDDHRGNPVNHPAAHRHPVAGGQPRRGSRSSAPLRAATAPPRVIASARPAVPTIVPGLPTALRSRDDAWASELKADGVGRTSGSLGSRPGQGADDERIGEAIEPIDCSAGTSPTTSSRRCSASTPSRCTGRFARWGATASRFPVMRASPSSRPTPGISSG